jgi:hypothetical protein
LTRFHSKNFIPHPIGFLGYMMISHESYHRGEICIALTESGHRLDDAVLYDRREWSRRLWINSAIV